VQVSDSPVLVIEVGNVAMVSWQLPEKEVSLWRNRFPPERLWPKPHALFGTIIIGCVCCGVKGEAPVRKEKATGTSAALLRGGGQKKGGRKRSDLPAYGRTKWPLATFNREEPFYKAAGRDLAQAPASDVPCRVGCSPIHL